MMLCQVVSEPKCGRPAQVLWQSPVGEIHICLTHHRIFTIGEFGERANPPWTKERALDALLNQDGLKTEDATKLVNAQFGMDKGRGR